MIMKTLTEKTNKLNVNDLSLELSTILNGAGQIITARTVQFFANEKNGNLSPIAEKALSWAKEKGFEMTSRPARKATVNDELYQGIRQSVIWQWTKYTIK
jgi:hypothetical protein